MPRPFFELPPLCLTHLALSRLTLPPRHHPNTHSDRREHKEGSKGVPKQPVRGFFECV